MDYVQVQQAHRSFAPGESSWRELELGRVLLYTVKGKPAAACFGGKRTKPDREYYYQSEEQRELAIKEWHDGLAARAKMMADYKAAKAPREGVYNVGDILTNSWGYDQTNIDFYQVVETRGKVVFIRPISSKVVPQSEGYSSMSENVIPAKDQFTGPVMRKAANPLGLNMPHGHATKWDGKPEHATYYA